MLNRASLSSVIPTNIRATVKRQLLMKTVKALSATAVRLNCF